MAKPLPPELALRSGRWPEDAAAIARVRRAVFIVEQAVPEVLEWEAIDPGCDWFTAWHGDAVIGICRLTPDGRIGRMAVLPEWRGLGIGSALLAMALSRARQHGLAEVELHAQCHAQGFYERFGFVAEGPEFDEAGITHRHMVLRLLEEDA